MHVIASAAKQSSTIVTRWIAASLALLAMTGCMPQAQNINPPIALEKNILSKNTLVAVDGEQLPLRMWLPGGKPNSVIIAVHGFNDYSHAFETTGAFFKARGVALIAYDQRGFGNTEPRGIWAGEQNLTRDLAQAVKQVNKKFPKTPVYILAESMGGAVAIVALSQPDFPKVKGLILSAPAVWGGEAMSPFFRYTLWLGAHTVPGMGFTGSDLKIQASNNIPMLRALSADPLFIKNTRVDAVYGLVRLMGDAYDNVPNVKTPTLLLYGDNDQVIPPSAVRAAAERFTIPVRVVWYPDGYHMLLRDLQGEDVMRDIASWMRNPKAPIVSGNEGIPVEDADDEDIDEPAHN